MNFKGVLFVKLKLMWLPFIPLLVAGVLLRVYQALFDPKGADVGLVHGGAITLGFAAIVIAVFVITGIISYTDKKTSALYEIKRNPPAGIFVIVAGALMFADSAISFTSGSDILSIIDAIVTVVGAVALILMGISSVGRSNKTKSAAGLMLVPALWGIVRTFLTFVSDTTVASESRDMMDIVFMIFGTFFLFNCGMVYINVKGKNAVKGCFVYGMPLILVSFAYTISHTIYQIKTGTFDFVADIRTFEFFAIALFALFFLIELTANATQRSKEEYEQAGVEIESKSEPEREEIQYDESFLGELSLEEDPLMIQAEKTMDSVKDDADKINEIKELRENLEEEEKIDDGELTFVGDSNSDMSVEAENDFDKDLGDIGSEPEQEDTTVQEDTEAQDSDVEEKVELDKKEDKSEGEKTSAASILDNYDISSINLEEIDRLVKELSEEENK